MSAHIVNLGSPAHRRCQDLLPWYVAGTLTAEESAAVEAHLQECADCRRDRQWNEQVRRAQADAPPAGSYDADRAFAALRQRLDNPTQAATSARPDSFPRRPGPAIASRRATHWRIAAGLVLACGTIFAAGLLLLAPRHEYHALARPVAASPARLVVVFAPQATAAQMRAVLLASDARIVDGPTAADAYTLVVDSARFDQAMQRLRADPSVLFVQALDAKDMH